MTKEEIKKLSMKDANDLTEHEVHVLFDYLIRNQMPEKEFWKWVAGWYDVDEIIRECDNWDVELKRDELRLHKYE